MSCPRRGLLASTRTSPKAASITKRKKKTILASTRRARTSPEAEPNRTTHNEFLIHVFLASNNIHSIYKYTYNNHM